MYLTGILIYILIVISITSLHSPLAILWDFPSLVLVIGGIVSSIVATNSIDDVVYSIKVLMYKTTELDRRKLDQCIGLYRFLFIIALASGGIGLIIGRIYTLMRIDDPSIIGPSMSKSLLPILYSLIIAFIMILPTQFILKKKLKNTYKD